MYYDELMAMVSPEETILYNGKPDKKCFILECIVNPLLPIAIVWAVIDFGIIGTSFVMIGSSWDFFIIPFMLLHLMPVWIYLFGVLFSYRRYRNTSYVVTDRAVYVSSGTFTKNFNVKPFAELSHVDLHRGIFDQMCNVGDIIMTSSQFNQDNTSASISIDSIQNYIEVYNLIKKLQQDIYSDIMYPNDLRPQENHGYNTKYKG
ncbi:MAG: PH domain-containing protein [Erysipelotrichaceae bacterium]